MLKLHVEVAVLNPEKKKKATAAWVVFEGKHVRGAGRISNDPKALIATSAGRTFAAELHAAHGKLVSPTSIPLGAPAAEKPKAAKTKKADANGEAAPADKPAKKGKAKKAEANGAAEAAPAADALVEAAAAEVTDEKPANKAKAKKAAAASEGHEIGNGVNGEAEMPAKKAKAAKPAKAEKPAKAAKKSKPADATAEA